MNNIKILTITFALMTTSAFADFTIKDLFVSGGTKSIQDNTKAKHEHKDAEKKRTQQDSQ